MSTIRTISTRILGGLAAGTLLLVGVATPASAATSAAGCTVNPRTPVAVTQGGVPKARYEVTIVCAGGRSVDIQQRQLESDFTGNELTGKASFTSTFVVGGPAVVSTTTLRPDTEIFNEEVLQSVRFRVHVGGWVSGWSNWERSGIRVMAN